MRLSRRLPWLAQENEIFRKVAEHREAGVPLLDLTVSNPTVAALPYPAEGIAAAFANPEAGTYDPVPLGMASARAAVAAGYARLGAAIRADALVLTASSSESYSLLCKVLCDPGDVVLYPEPSYPLFEHLIAAEGAVARPYRLNFDGRWRIDFSSIDCDGARALVVVNPNNPTGSFLNQDDWERLQYLAARHDLSLIADEVFADFPIDPPTSAVRTVAATSPNVPTFCLGGLSKSCGLPQIKLGWIALLGPPAQVDTARAALELATDTYLSVSTPVQLALPRFLDLGTQIRHAIAARVLANHRTLAARLPTCPPCTLLPIEGGWSAVLRVPHTLTDEQWSLRLLAEDGVLVQPGFFFDFASGAYLIASLLTPPDIFNEGIGKLLARVSS